MGRKAISKKIRFEVFKRDSFTCQYCGKSAPDVVLNVDHINPVAEGGDNNILNLATSCFDCNSGKGKRKLDDSAVVKKQVDQLRLITERKQQIEMMAQWREESLKADDLELSILQKQINTYFDGTNRVVTDSFLRTDIKTAVKKYGFSMVSDAIDASAAQYLSQPERQEDRSKFLDMIPRICYWKKREIENPVEAEFRKMAYSVNRKWYSCNPQSLSHRLIRLHNIDRVPKEVIYAALFSSTGIMSFEEQIQEYFDGEDNG